MQNNFPFSDPENMATIACCHVMREGAPVLYASHDADDGMWQFLCGARHHQTEDAMVVALEDVYRQDTSIGEVAGLPLGYIATRKKPGKKWKAQRVV